MLDDFIRVAGFLDNSTVNGEGIRSVLFVSGCNINCKGCQNKEMQNLYYGDVVTIGEVMDRIKENIPIIDGVTISGGDPTMQPTQVSEIINLCHELKLNVWLCTGRTYEYLQDHKELHGLLEADVIVDGPFIEELKDSELKYRGSSNQRIIVKNK